VLGVGAANLSHRHYWMRKGSLAACPVVPYVDGNEEEL
jgi:hypothetical protein